MPAITPLPTPTPSRVDGSTLFSQRADAFLGAFPLLVTEINAAMNALSLNSTNGTSATSMLIGTGSKTFVVETGKSYVPGQTLKIAYTADGSNWMLGDVTAYDIATGSLTIMVLYKQGSGTYAAWTLSLSAPLPSIIPSGSKMLFYQSVAPTGWTQDTTHNDKALRVVSGAGAGSGGSVAFSNAFKSQAVAGSNSATTLDSTQIPQHTHPIKTTANGTGGGGGAGQFVEAGGGSTGNTLAQTGTTGQSHNHTFTGTAINLAVQYLDLIICTKD